MTLPRYALDLDFFFAMPYKQLFSTGKGRNVIRHPTPPFIDVGTFARTLCGLPNGIQ